MKSGLLARVRVPLLAVVATCLLASGSGWAIAASTSSSATLRACANKTTGALRLAGKCKSNERRVTWNTVGPRGLRGLQGIQGTKGDAGATGAIGPSDVFAKNAAGPVSITSSTTVGSISLPAGTYLVFARLSLQGAQQIVRCNFSPTGTANKDSVNTTIAGFQIEAPLFDTESLNSSTSVAVVCTAFGSGATAYDIVLNAIKIGSLTTS